MNSTNRQRILRALVAALACAVVSAGVFGLNASGDVAFLVLHAFTGFAVSWVLQKILARKSWFVYCFTLITALWLLLSLQIVGSTSSHELTWPDWIHLPMLGLYGVGIYYRQVAIGILTFLLLDRVIRMSSKIR